LRRIGTCETDQTACKSNCRTGRTCCAASLPLSTDQCGRELVPFTWPRMCVERYHTGDGVRPGAARMPQQSSPATLADATAKLAGGARPGVARTPRQTAWAEVRVCRQRWRTPRQSVRAVAIAELAGGARPERAGGRNDRARRRRWQTQ
jgi:hypothetical protein